MPRPPGAQAPKRAGQAGGRAAGGPKQVWLLKDGQPVAVKVTAGLSNGRLTEVSGDGLVEGAPVITDQLSGAAP